jgi:glucose/arabinose dehydrogenase
MRGLAVTLGTLLPAIGKFPCNHTPSNLPAAGDDPLTPRPALALSSSASIPSSCGLKDAFPLAAADGWSWVKIAGGLKKPRGVVVDAKGNLLVVEAGKGVTAHVFGSDGCVSSTHAVIDNSALNHGIELTPDGSQLVVSSMSTVWRYDYDAETQSVSMPKVLVKGMYEGGHPTRTTVIPPATPHLLLVSLGSNTNMDWESRDKWVGRSLVKVFDISTTPDGGYDYNSQGWFLGYGLRNEVALVVDKNNM